MLERFCVRGDEEFACASVAWAEVLEPRILIYMEGGQLFILLRTTAL